jgi:hypothetical protein
MDVHDDSEGRRVRIDFSDIADAKLVLTDQLIQESLRAQEARSAKTSH